MIISFFFQEINFICLIYSWRYIYTNLFFFFFFCNKVNMYFFRARFVLHQFAFTILFTLTSLLLIEIPNLSIYTSGVFDFRVISFSKEKGNGSAGKRWHRSAFVKYDFVSFFRRSLTFSERAILRRRSDPAECRGIRNWGLACHKYWWRNAVRLGSFECLSKHDVRFSIEHQPTSQAGRPPGGWSLSFTSHIPISGHHANNMRKTRLPRTRGSIQANTAIYLFQVQRVKFDILKITILDFLIDLALIDYYCENNRKESKLIL